jgi:hypothetical protein
MLANETRLFWIAAQRLRLTKPDDNSPEIDEALDDLVCISVHTDSARLAHRCADLLDRELERCESSA